jgi:nitrous oxidase accessory protein NosD
MEKTAQSSNRKIFYSIASLGLILSALVSCKSDTGVGTTIRVPQDVTTVGGAVAKAKPGDLVLVSPGTYHEKVLIDRPGITLRGTDRNTVIFDGEYNLQNGIEVAADGVVVENLTAHSYNGNGVFFNGVYSPTGVDKTKVYGTGANALKGYRASYVTSYNNGLYGIYAFAARGGQIDHSYVSGNADSGIYVGQCKPCNVLITDVIAERNPVGYFGTNASEGVFVVNSIFRSNRLGVWPNTEDENLEKLAPQTTSVVAGNLIINSGSLEAPAQGRGGNGDGVVINGGSANVITKNRVVGSSDAGVLIIDAAKFPATSNRVEANVLDGNGVDLVYSPSKPTSAGNCFVGNTFASSSPPAIESVLGCALAPTTAVKVTPFAIKPSKGGPTYRTTKVPGPQTTMPNAETAPGIRAAELVPKVDLATISLPTA